MHPIGNNISVEEWLAEHGQWPPCQARGEQIQRGEDFYYGSDGCRYEACSRTLLDEAEVENCRSSTLQLCAAGATARSSRIV